MAIREQYLEVPGINQFKDMHKGPVLTNPERLAGGFWEGPCRCNSTRRQTRRYLEFYVWQCESVLSGMDALRGENFLFPVS
jgi:hypothetical protein